MKTTMARVCTWSGTRRRTSAPRRTPQYYGLPYEDVHFASAHADRVRLSGWIIPAHEPRGVVILCHGHTSTRAHLLDKAVMLNAHHFTTLLFDFRARGLSEGELCTLGARETDDVLGAVAFLQQRPGLKDLPIGALGESMGGAAVIQAAARTQALRCVIAEASYAALDRVVQQRLTLALGPFASGVLQACRRISAEEMALDISQVSPEAQIARIGPRPVFLITDGLDLTCPRRESDRLFAAAHEPKERWIAASAPHCLAFRTYREAYTNRVSAFLQHNLHA
jgi:fermentation-respiration switch protein FrsA (DUF1100 family)